MSARAELSLRQRLSQREERISELKDALTAAQHSPRQQTGSHYRSRSPSPPAHVPDHAAYRSSAHHQSTAPDSHATHDRHREIGNSRGHNHLGSQQGHSSPRADHRAPQNSPERARSDYQHVSHTHQQQQEQQQVDAASVHTARLPYFKPKSLETAVGVGQISSATVNADKEARPVGFAGKQGSMPQTLTGRCLQHLLSSAVTSFICSHRM